MTDAITSVEALTRTLVSEAAMHRVHVRQSGPCRRQLERLT
jgi:hypothetical protein